MRVQKLIAKLNVEEQDVGALYQQLAGRSMKEILFHLFEQQSFTHRDALDANSTLKCDTRLRSSEVFLEHLAGLPKSETFSWA